MSWSAMLQATAVALANPSLAEGRSDTITLSVHDLEQIEHVIQAQLAAFHDGHVDAVWQLCAPRTQEKIGSADKLFRDVLLRAPILMDVTRLRFGEFSITPFGLGLDVTLFDLHGQSAQVAFIIERQRQGSWLIRGIRPAEPESQAQAAAA